MLTKRQNLLETIHGGNPDRFVNQYEAFGFVLSLPKSLKYPDPKRGELNVKVAWGVTKGWPENLPGAFPVHDAAHIVCPDLAEWKKTVMHPKRSILRKTGSRRSGRLKPSTGTNSS